MMNGNVLEALEAVQDKTSFLQFVEALYVDRIAANSLPQTMDGFQGEWANHTIEHFLEAAVAWAYDSEFGAQPSPARSNPWQLLAQFLWAGRSYE
jgi:alcohol dehydrogenase YqhD (iron-dependent ADH family)